LAAQEEAEEEEANADWERTTTVSQLEKWKELSWKKPTAIGTFDECEFLSGLINPSSPFYDPHVKNSFLPPEVRAREEERRKILGLPDEAERKERKSPSGRRLNMYGDPLPCKISCQEIEEIEERLGPEAAGRALFPTCEICYRGECEGYGPWAGGLGCAERQ
jgi:hypothetical protein